VHDTQRRAAPAIPRRTGSVKNPPKGVSGGELLTIAIMDVVVVVVVVELDVDVDTAAVVAVVAVAVVVVVVVADDIVVLVMIVISVIDFVAVTLRTSAMLFILFT